MKSNDTESLLMDPSIRFSSTYSFTQWPHYTILIILLYLLITGFLRNQRLRANRSKFPYPTQRSFASMSVEDAYRIQQTIAELEFPFTFEKALQFALFRTYGIPSVSKLLNATSELSSPVTASKRFTDTTVLILEFMTNAPTSARTIEAISRMNYIHSGYQKAGKISDEDMLYTLSLFALEPIRWIGRYEWRGLEDFEKCAIGTFWKSMGDAMGIPYDRLESGKTGFLDGLQWLDEIQEWAETYEVENMKPHPSNHQTAEQTTLILLWNVPPFLHPLGKEVVATLMDDRLRTAMMYPPPPKLLSTLVTSTLSLRAFLIRHLFLPRPSFLRLRNTGSAPTPQGTYHLMRYVAAPFYIQPTVWRRWGPPSWGARLLGLPLPGDEGDRYRPGGYRVGDVGPDRMQGKGEAWARESQAKLREMRRSGCPFSMR